MTIHLYGIPNCDTMKKARNWLAAQGIEYIFHDYKKEGVDRTALESWADTVGWEVLLNRRGTTFRKLPDADKADIDRGKAITLMMANPGMIKRPVAILAGGKRVLVGFTPDQWAAAFG